MKRALALGTFAALMFVVFVAADDFKIFPRSEPKPPVNRFEPAPVAVPSDTPVMMQISVKPATEREFQLLRKRATPSAYFAEVVLLDEEGRKAYGVASVIVEPGTRERVTAKIRGGEVELNVAIDRQATRAMAEATVTKNGAVVQKQKSDVMLRVSPPQGIIPIR